ncbi:hypothetical protein R1flu_023358 [Riccia fluitans]|uniref:Allene oxide synthase n=1 Tax=Riccia fluitans TaxID=41844 RepID=A0ABD1XUU6_9MARC
MAAMSIRLPGLGNPTVTGSPPVKSERGRSIIRVSLNGERGGGSNSESGNRSLKATGAQPRAVSTDVQTVFTSSDDATTSTSSGLPLRDVPGCYGIPFVGAFWDKMATYWFEGMPGFHENRRVKYNSTVYRMNTVPGPPFFPDPRVIVLLDQKSFQTLFDMDKVEKRDVFTGTYVPSLEFTGGYRVLPYLDPSEEKHALLKTFCFEVLKSSGKRVFPEFHSALSDVFVAWEAGLKKDGNVKFNQALAQATLRFNIKAFLNVDPTDPNVEANMGKDAVRIVNLYNLAQIFPTVAFPLSLPAKLFLGPLIELLLHTFPVPFLLLKPNYDKLLAFFRANSDVLLDVAETLTLDRDEALHNLLFNTVFNSWGGINFLFPQIVKTLGSTSIVFQRELSAEVRRAIRENGGLNPAALRAMPRVESAVLEVFRLHPPVPFQYARAKKDLIIESHDAAFRVKKGEMLAGFNTLACKDPKVFTDPEVYNPDRFLGEEGQKLVQCVLWSNGPQTDTPSIYNKQCPGKNFITTIAQLLVAEIYSIYETISVQGDTLTALQRHSA